MFNSSTLSVANLKLFHISKDSPLWPFLQGIGRSPTNKGRHSTSFYHPTSNISHQISRNSACTDGPHRNRRAGEPVHDLYFRTQIPMVAVCCSTLKHLQLQHFMNVIWIIIWNHLNIHQWQSRSENHHTFPWLFNSPSFHLLQRYGLFQIPIIHIDHVHPVASFHTFHTGSLEGGMLDVAM